MDQNKTYAILFAFIAIMYVSSAYGLKVNEKKRQQTLARVKVNDDDSVKTAHRIYKSTKGYLSFTFYDSIVAAVLSGLVAILSYASPVFDFIGPILAIILYIASNLFLYRRFKEM